MRVLSADPDAFRYVVYLNYELQSYVVEADDDEGYLITLALSPDGPPIRTRWDGDVLIFKMES